MVCVEIPEAPQLHYFVADGVMYINLCYAPESAELPVLLPV